MDVYKIALQASSKEELKKIFDYIVRNYFRIDPCSGYPQIEEAGKDTFKVVLMASSANLKKLEEGDYEFEVVKDFTGDVDPREYVSKTNRFKAELDKLRSKGK